MESTLHRQLKRIWAGPEARCEVRLGQYIIDCVVDDELIEIQHGSLTAIRDKIAHLLERHRVRVVKPIIIRKVLCKRRRKNGTKIERRLSPKSGGIADLFGELMHFTRVFPHPRLILDVPLIEVEEWRIPGHGRRRRWRANDQITEDQTLTRLADVVRLSTVADLRTVLEPAAHALPPRFHTGDLAKALTVPRWQAQQIAYVLRHCAAVTVVGKHRVAWLYEWQVEAEELLSQERAA